MAESFHVTPWKVEGKVNYEMLEKQFGIKPINDELLNKDREVHRILFTGC